MTRRRSRTPKTTPAAQPTGGDQQRAARTQEIQSVVQQALAELYGAREQRPSAKPAQNARQQQPARQQPGRRAPRRKEDLAPKMPPARTKEEPKKEPVAAKPAAKPTAAKAAPKRTSRGANTVPAAPTRPQRGPLSAPRGNYAFIDGTNLNVSIRYMGWSMDWTKFRTYLHDAFNVTRAYYFLGYLEENEEIYGTLRDAGFELVFKPTLVMKDGTVKGNCDAELVLQTMIDLPYYDRAVVVTGDGDFASLVAHLRFIGKLAVVLVPNSKRYSSLLKSDDEDIAFIDAQRASLAYVGEKKKA